MEIDFDSPKLEKLFNSHKDLVRKYGDRMAGLIRRRLDDLDAADNLEHIRNLPGRCHELHGDKKTLLSIDLIHPQRLIFKSNDSPIPTKPDGGLDWQKVTKITVIGIEDTHA